MKKYLIIFTLLFIIFPFMVNAATELSASTQNPVVGTNIYVQLDANYGNNYQISSMHLLVNYDTSYLELDEVIWIQTRASYTEKNGVITIDKDGGNYWDTGAIMQFKFKVLKAGISTISVAAKRDSHNAVIDSYYSNGTPIGQSFGKVSISASNPSTSTIIKALGVEGYTLQPTFSKTNYFYNLTVPSDVTTVNITAEKGSSGQTITGTGKRALQYGDNRVRVIVTAQDGTSRTYEIMINRTDNRTGDTSLKSISVSNTNIKIEEGKTTYEATVGRSIDNVLITARTNDPNATLSGTGKKSLIIGKNTFTLTVSSSGGKETTYTIIVNRSTEDLQTNIKSSKLISLKVNSLVMDLSNKRTTWLYGVSNEYNELDIEAISESSTATVKIKGNKNLKEGLNKITITVTETNEEVTEYTLIIYKNPDNVTIINDLNNINSDSIYLTTSQDPITIPVTNLNKNKYKLYYNVVNIYNGLLYQIVLSNNIPQKDFTMFFTKNNSNTLSYQTNIPAGNNITLYLNEVYKDNQVVKIYTYNDDNNYTLLTDGITVKDGYISFTTNGDKNYIITNIDLIEEEGPFDKLVKKYGKYIIITIILSIIIIIIYIKIKKKLQSNERKEPSY